MILRHTILQSQKILQDWTILYRIFMSCGPVTPQVAPRHNWSGRTIHGRFGCHRWSGRTIYGCRGWSALPQVVPHLFCCKCLIHAGSLATCSLPSTIYMVEWMLHGLSKPRGPTPAKILYEISKSQDFWKDFGFLRLQF